MKRLCLWALDWIATIFIVVFIIGACAIYGFWSDPFGDNDGEGWT